MMNLGRALLILYVALVLGCGGGGETSEPSADAGDSSTPVDAEAADTPAPAVDEGETAGDHGAEDPGGAEPDMGVDTGPVAPADPPWAPPDETLRLSWAEGDLDIPFGISTAGYGQKPRSDAPKSPFADGFRATTTLLDPPGVRVLHLVGGGERIVLIQTDLIGIYFTLFERLQEIVWERSGIDLRDSGVLMANHSHSGPARIVNFVIGAALADTYDEHIFERIVQSIADPVVRAMSSEAEAVRVGYTITTNAEVHADRRCENPDYTNDSLGVIRFDRADGGGTAAVLVNHSLHGTILSERDSTLSGDAPRLIELKLSEALGGVPVLFAQSWGGDMQPGHADRLLSDAAPESPVRKSDRMEALGRSFADSVLAVWDDITFTDDPALGIVSEEVLFRHDLIGYGEGEFDYEFGGAYCGGTTSMCENGVEPKMDTCVPVPEQFTVPQTRLSAMRIGDLALVTLPGEPLTTLGERLLEQVLEGTPAETAMLLGYAQDYTGYLLLPDDWRMGGYAAGSNLWGPKQGTYLADRVTSLAVHLFNPDTPIDFEPAAARGYTPGEGAEYVPAPSVEPGTVAQDLPESAESGAILELRWRGGDPWVDNPSVVVETADDSGTFSPLEIGGRVVDQRDYRVILQLEVEPPWTEDAPADGARSFTWIAHVRTSVRAPAPVTDVHGRLRVRVSGRAVGADGAAVYELTSGEVDVAAPAGSQ